MIVFTKIKDKSNAVVEKSVVFVEKIFIQVRSSSYHPNQR